MGMLINRHRDRHDADPVKDVDEMTVAELRAYAKDHDINLGGATKKDDILAAIYDAEGVQVGEGFDPGEPVDGEVGGEPV